MRQSISRMMVPLCLFPSIALSHTGVGQTSGYVHGFCHPMGGADHLLAMFAVGLWAAQIGGRATWLVPSTFVAVMVLGGVLGFWGVPIPFIEHGILVSVLLLGVLIVAACRLPTVYSALIVGLLAVFHGYAHGAEMPAATEAASYTAGFAMATATLHLSGVGVGMILQNVNLQAVNRLAGGAIALGGIYLAIA
jgi:urease accessory protein